MSDTILSITNASFGYSNTNRILFDVNLTLKLGDFILLVGANGCGKSTLIRGIFKLIPYQTGTIIWSIPQNLIGYIPQESSIDYDSCATALDVVRSAQPTSWSTNVHSALEALRGTQMHAHAQKRFGSLSGGQKRRILLSRALLGNPKILILDEPTVNTDRETEQSLEQLLISLSTQKQVCVLATTHSEKWAQTAYRYHIERGRLNA